MTAAASSACASTVSGVWPPELATPVLLNRMTGRFAASPSVTAGSQLSMPLRKCWRNTTGVPVSAPKRRYAYRTPFAVTNWFGAVAWEGRGGSAGSVVMFYSILVLLFGWACGRQLGG